METPSSIRRVTRSQFLSSEANNGGLPFPATRKLDESEKGKTKSMQRQDRSVLIDITNGSPIIGLAMGNLETPSSAVSKKKALVQSAPGSGEALLRCQVKSLLQKVEEEGEPSKIEIENRPLFMVYGLSVDSPIPISLVAPTPANTPQIADFSNGSDILPSITPVVERILVPQMKIEDKNEGIEDENMISRSLLLDFSEKSKSSGGSSCKGEDKMSSGEKLCTDDDSSSIWSIQANASSTMDEDDEYEVIEWPEDEDYYEQKDGEEDEELMNELCQGMNRMRVGDWPKFTSKHIRFVYNSDDEIEGEEEVKNSNDFECEEPSAASRGEKAVLC